MNYELQHHLRTLANGYNAAVGLKRIETKNTAVNVTLSHEVALYYLKAESKPYDHTVRAAYAALNLEVQRQFDYLSAFGYQLIPTNAAETYSHVDTMALDIADKRLRVWDGGVPEHGLIDRAQNMKFRFVHDIFGHVMTGAQFGHVGEEMAYRCHYQMFDYDARLALATETRGQNCALHFGPDGDPDLSAPGFNAKFHPQKAFIMSPALRAI